ncbi:MAG TPA: sodium:solute symporter, partial [Pedococcus sp.]|nr:sodium:solute symporter [Pedococcus sp.]
FGGSLNPIPAIGDLGYIAMTAFVINILVAVALSLVFRALNVDAGHDETIKGDYFADAGDPRVEKNLVLDTHLTTGAP